ncbi:hypothetical protein KSC_090080 [Ktedonobacter sp. SOSP1-52]|nr:hypothetical protein KSC_090080 [Ktedonobacter sp. SOSP1-52]
MALVIEGANRHDMKLVAATLEHHALAHPESTLEHPQHLCLDADYDYDVIYSLLYEPHVRLNRHNHAWYWQALEQQGDMYQQPRSLPTLWKQPKFPNDGWLNASSPGSTAGVGL